MSIRYYTASMLAVVLIAPAYFVAQEKKFPDADAAQLASRFKFTKTQLPEIPGAQHKAVNVREVHPSLKRIAAWISTLGAAATLADLDGDGLANDIVHIDPRTDLVTVLPAPGTGERYAPFALDAAPLPFDAATTSAHGSLAGDFNEDGLQDVLVYFWGRTPVIYMQKAGSGGLTRASFIAQELTDSGERWFTETATHADLDGDGHADLLICNYFQDGAQILDANASGTQVMHEGKAKAANGGRKHFFLSQNAQGFAEVKGVLPEEVDRGWTLAVGALDLDGDQLPEIYLGNDFGHDRLLHNHSTRGHLAFTLLEGERDFFTPKSCVLGKDSFKGMGVDFGDVNGDGRFDIYVSNIATKFGLTESHFLWINNGDNARMANGVAPFTHGAEKYGVARSGWGWDARLADFDNDGQLEAVQACGFIKGKINRWPELQALGTSNDQIVHNPGFWPNFKPGADLSGYDRNPFFVMGKDGRFHDIAAQLGLDDPMVSRAIATGDVDGDGRLDYVLANQWEPSFFFHNDAPAAGRFLGLHVMLSDTAAITDGHPQRGLHAWPAIGAIVTVHLPNGRERVAYVDGGSGHSGKRSPDIHLGLGDLDANTELAVTVRWRDSAGAVQENNKLRLKPGWHTLLLAAKSAPIALAK